MIASLIPKRYRFLGLDLYKSLDRLLHEGLTVPVLVLPLKLVVISVVIFGHRVAQELSPGISGPVMRMRSNPASCMLQPAAVGAPAPPAISMAMAMAMRRPKPEVLVGIAALLITAAAAPGLAFSCEEQLARHSMYGSYFDDAAPGSWSNLSLAYVPAHGNAIAELSQSTFKRPLIPSRTSGLSTLAVTARRSHTSHHS